MLLWVIVGRVVIWISFLLTNTQFSKKYGIFFWNLAFEIKYNICLVFEFLPLISKPLAQITYESKNRKLMDALRNCTTRFWAPVYPHHPMHVPCSLFRVSQIGGSGPNLTFQRDAKQLDEGFSIQSQNIILRRLNSRQMDTNSLMY